jgi:hypothetical protein
MVMDDGLGIGSGGDKINRPLGSRRRAGPTSDEKTPTSDEKTPTSDEKTPMIEMGISSQTFSPNTCWSMKTFRAYAVKEKEVRRKGDKEIRIRTRIRI